MGKVSSLSPGCQYDPSRVSVGNFLASPALTVVSTSFHRERYEVERVAECVDCDFHYANLITEEGTIVMYTKGVDQNGIRHAIVLSIPGSNTESRPSDDKKDRPGSGSTPGGSPRQES